METSRSESLPPSRRAILTGAAAGFAGMLLPVLVDQAPAHADGPLFLQAEGIRLDVNSTGLLSFSDGSGSQLMQIQHFMVKDSVLNQQRTFGGTASLVGGSVGGQAIKIVYNMAAAASAISVVGTIELTAHRANLRWEVTGSSDLLPSGFMFSRALVGSSAAEQYTPLTVWNRDSGGGVPFETNDGGVYQETFSNTRAYLSLQNTNPKYTNATWVHSPATSSGPASATTVHSTEVALVVGEIRPAAAKTIGAKRPVGVELWTDQAFNIWENTSAPMNLKAQITNGSAAAVTASLTWWAKDFNGASIGSQTLSVDVPAGSVIDRTFTINQPHPGVTFTEVSASVGAGSAFSRTNLAVLSSYDYQAGSASIFGLSNYAWLHEPSTAAVLGLMKKIGVQRVRIAYDGADGMSPAILDGASIDHNIQLGRIPIDGTPAEGTTWAQNNVATAITAGAKYFEVGNELNNPWTKGLKATEYVNQGLAPAKARLTALGSSMKVLNAGTGGMDRLWLTNFKNAGGWDLIDGLAIHPGRGNFTPDYYPPLSEWQTEVNDKYWNYFGALDQAKAMITEFGGNKELWLTEAYACTKPNSWWHDTVRHAAENILLSFALALSVGVRGVNWYQLHDSVVLHPQEADPGNHEYHYGLMNRDTSAKPSLLAYATAARAFDQCTFVRKLNFADSDIKGLQFKNADGLYLAILWSRKDGYILNLPHGDTSYFPSPEAWTDPWPTKTTLSLRATGSSVRQSDSIGVEEVLLASAGKVQVKLDGAPRLYWGLAADVDA